MSASSSDSCVVSAEHLSIARAHAQAVAAGERTYNDPVTGFAIMTSLHHRRRGFCCGSACRHCPYDWEKVDAERLEGVASARVLRRTRNSKIEDILAAEKP